jgi:hypothetical protein
MSWEPIDRKYTVVEIPVSKGSRRKRPRWKIYCQYGPAGLRPADLMEYRSKRAAEYWMSEYKWKDDQWQWYCYICRESGEEPKVSDFIKYLKKIS